MKFYDCGCDKQYTQTDPPVIRTSCREHRMLAAQAVGEALLEMVGRSPSDAGVEHE